MSRSKTLPATLVVLSFLGPALNHAAAITVLHEFAGGFNDGDLAEGLMLSGSTLFGTTAYGYNDAGTVYSLNTDGSGFRLLHAFAASPYPDGKIPQGVLVLSGSTLFGTTVFSGADLEGGGT